MMESTCLLSRFYLQACLIWLFLFLYTHIFLLPSLYLWWWCWRFLSVALWIVTAQHGRVSSVLLPKRFSYRRVSIGILFCFDHWSRRHSLNLLLISACCFIDIESRRLPVMWRANQSYQWQWEHINDCSYSVLNWETIHFPVQTKRTPTHGKYCFWTIKLI